jgi:hypothetical protein
MKAGVTATVIGIITTFIRLAPGLGGGYTLEPTAFVPSAPTATTITAQDHQSLTGGVMAPRTVRRSFAMDAGKRVLFYDPDFQTIVAAAALHRTTAEPPTRTNIRRSWRSQLSRKNTQVSSSCPG